MFYTPPLAPYFGGTPYPQQPQPQRKEISMVAGETGANALPMAPNSSDLALDTNGEIVWLIKTDSAGVRTIAPYDIKPHEAAPAPDYSNLEERIRKLEEAIKHADTADPATARADYTAYSSGTAPASAHTDQANDRRNEKRR